MPPSRVSKSKVAVLDLEFESKSLNQGPNPLTEECSIYLAMSSEPFQLVEVDAQPELVGTVANILNDQAVAVESELSTNHDCDLIEKPLACEVREDQDDTEATISAGRGVDTVGSVSADVGVSSG